MIQNSRIAGAGLLVATLALTGCAGGAASQSSTDALVIGTGVEPPNWVVPQAGGYLPYYQSVYDSLLRMEPSGEIVPMLAETFEYNADNTVLTLDLRTDVTFSDGEAFTAEVAATNLETFRDSSAPDAANLSSLTTATAVDEDTVELTLAQPDPAMLNYLTRSAGTMISPAALGGDGAGGPVGSGPYRYDAAASIAGSSHVFTKTPDYWAPELQKFERVEFRVYADPTATTNALRSGQIDGSTVSRTADIEQLVSAGFTDNVQELDWQGLLILDHSGKIAPELKDVRVRQAMNFAIDGDSILETVFSGRGTPTTQIFSPNGDGFDEALDSQYDFDPEKAKALLAEAGLSAGFSLDMPRASGVDPAVYTTIQQNLADVGITVNYVDVTVNDLINGMLSGQYAVSWFQLAQPNDWQLIQEDIATGSLWNPLGDADPTVDALIARILGGDTAATAELNAYVVDQAWFNPWFRSQASYITSNKITVEVQFENAQPSIYNYAPAQ